MTLDDLREKMKAAYPGACDKFAFINSDRANMRQSWVQVCEVIKLHEALPGKGFVHPDVIRFHQAGIVYYHAKKHGLKSAAMLKLTL